MDLYPDKQIFGKSIDNFGISGASTEDLFKVLMPELKGCYSNTVLMIGINDLRFSYEFKESISFLEQSIKKLINISDNLYVWEVMHNNGNIYVNNSQIDEYNFEIKNLSKKYKFKLLSFDSFYNQYGKVLYQYSQDGVHLTREGYAKFEEILDNIME